MNGFQPRRFQGTRDFLPADMIPREEMLAKIKKVFSLFGYDPLETPAIEYLDVLTGKYGGECEKLIYRLDYKTGSKDAAGLKYDLTVPLCRVAAMHNDIQFPFRRYQIQPVWRAERPQLRRGRYREFYQCDADIIGAEDVIADAEIITLIVEILNRLGLQNTVVKLNNRKILRGMMILLSIDAAREPHLLRCIDKFDKIGVDGVRNEMRKAGFSPDEIEKAVELFISTALCDSPLDLIGGKLDGISIGEEGIAETGKLLTYLDSFGVGGSVKFEPPMVRGLDYYTGPIFEAVIPALPDMGSLAGGGRYDGLIGVFSGKVMPATGVTIGLDRIYTALEQLELVERVGTRTVALVSVFNSDTMAEAIEVASLLRAGGINAALYPAADKLKKQFRYADRLGARYVVLVGPDEAQRGTAVLKDLAKGEQREVEVEKLVEEIGE